MKKQYQEWIEKNVSDPYYTCAARTTEMAKAFPELTRVRGHYCDAACGVREHWWLVDEHGGEVDPTAAQFPTKGNGFYEIWDESLQEPNAMCLNCGEYFYSETGDQICSENCHIEFAAHCMGG